jgi:hypothetical protein
VFIEVLLTARYLRLPDLPRGPSRAAGVRFARLLGIADLVEDTLTSGLTE